MADQLHQTVKLTVSNLSKTIHRRLMQEAYNHGGLSDAAMVRLILAERYGTVTRGRKVVNS